MRFPFRSLIACFLFGCSALPLAASPAIADPPPADNDQTESVRESIERQLAHVGCGKARALALRKLAGEFVDEDPVGLAVMREAASDTDVLHYNLELEMFPASASLAGTNVITVQSLIDGLTEFSFRLRDNFTITASTVNGSTPITVLNVSTTTRTAQLDRAYSFGEVFTVEITYNGPAVSRGFGSIEFDTHNSDDLVTTLSEPYFAYTWWPCKDGDFGEPGDNADKATVEIALIAPDTMRSVSNGTLQGIDALSGGRSRYRWASNYPIATYLVAFSSTNYNTWTQTYNYGTGTMPVEFNIYPEDDTAGNRAGWNKCLQMLTTYRDVFGLYPFVDEKYGMYQFNFGGGMEHQTNTGQGGFWEWVTAHELTHQWWGDNVTCRTWSDIWLNEGFATYGEALWYERKPGSSGLPALHDYMAGRVPGFVGDSVYVYDTTDFGRIFDGDLSYRKGGWVLHQLRHVVGDATFFNIISEYRDAFEGSAATTDDFATIASAVYGEDLTWFFDEWIYDIGAPEYRFGWQTEQIDGDHYLRLYIDQVQNASYPTFTMPLDVRVDFAGGDQTYVVFNDADPEHFVIPIPEAATNVVLDEFNWVLHTSLSQVSYVDGPPKIVKTSPAPGESPVPSSSPSQATVTFSEDVSASATDFEVTEAGGDTVGFTMNYSPANYTATLDFGGPLATGEYTITVRDTVQSAAAGVALDGEIGDPANPASLPSGEGLAGGDAVFAFIVRCPGDLDGDGDVDLSDLATLISNYGTGGATYADGDIDGDGDVDLSDLSAMLAHYGGAGC